MRGAGQMTRAISEGFGIYTGRVRTRARPARAQHVTV